MPTKNGMYKDKSAVPKLLPELRHARIPPDFWHTAKPLFFRDLAPLEGRVPKSPPYIRPIFGTPLPFSVCVWFVSVVLHEGYPAP